MRTRKGAFAIAFALLLGAGLLISCSSDSPTRPSSGPTGGGGTGGGGTSTTFAITLNVGPGEILVDDTEGILVTVNVRRNDTGQAPPNGSTVTVTTTRGSFGALNSGSQSEVLQLLNGSATIRFFGGTNEGAAVIQARVDQSVGQAQILVRTEAAFALGSVTPFSGDPGGGQTVTITGQGFKAPVQVEFQIPGNPAVVAQVLSVTPTQIRVVVPPSPQTVGVGQTLLANLAVTIAAGSLDQTTQVLSGAFRYALGGSLLRPVVSTVTPTSGPNEGGTRVRILGDGFESPVQVLFGNGTVPASFQGTEAIVQSVTRTEIVAVTPSAIGVGQDNRNSFVNLLVRNQATGAAIIEQAAFRYGQSSIFISSISPGTGPYSGGTRVTLFGSGFDEPVQVSFAGVGASIISVTGTEVIARTNGVVLDSCGDVSGATILTNIETGDQASGPGFIYRVPDVLVSRVEPTSLGAEGGTVTITGSNFDTPVQVLFGSQRGEVLSVSEDGTTIRVVAPAFTGTFPTESCTTGSNQGTRSLPVQVDLQVTSLRTTCDDTIPDGITYNPSAADATCSPDRPEASFSFSTNDTVVSFQNTSSNFSTSAWNFGDGTSSTATNPTHDYSGSVPVGATRTFTVVLTVSNTTSGGEIQTSSTSRQVVVTNPAPPPPPP